MNPKKGLPEDVFVFLSSISPVINVDLLIKDKHGRTLLTWRDDIYNGAGWHIPGGVIRFKETLAERVRAVAAGELGARVKFTKEPIAVNEVIHPSRKPRGHFISLLYHCELISPLDKKIKFKGGRLRPGDWAWHKNCPSNIIAVHRMYRKFIHSPLENPSLKAEGSRRLI